MKKLILLIALTLAALQCYAGQVDVKTAQSTAQQFMLAKVNNGRLMANNASDVKLVHQEMGAAGVATPVYYIFNASNGFVIVSAEDRGAQLLAYGDQPLDLDNMPSNMKFWLSTYKEQIEYLQAHPGMKVETRLSSPTLKAGTTVSPLLTANWSQNAPYYNQCPKSGTAYCMTGCPATSAAMVFHYWKYPDGPTPTVPGYTTESLGLVVDELPSITFDWANMLNYYTSGYTTTQSDAVAWLMRYIGQCEKMDYSPSGSGAMGEDIEYACRYFGYEDAYLIYKTNFDDNANEVELVNDEEWATLVQNELAAGRPIIYCGYEYTWTGHAFNVDGYDASTDTYHVNWGWGGTDNGYFAMNAFVGAGYLFDRVQQMIIGIEPPPSVPTIRCIPSQLSIKGYVDKAVTDTITVKGFLLTDNVSLTLDDPGGVFSLSATSLSADEVMSGKDVLVTYTPNSVGSHTATVTLSSTGAEDVTVTLYGTGVFEMHKPVMLAADEDYINLTQFRADWTDETPSSNVASYTLEVNAQPTATVIADVDFSDLPSGNNVATTASNYLPDGWTFTGSSLWLDGGCLSMGQNGIITTSTLDISGYDKVTVIVSAKNDSQYANTANMTVQTSLTAMDQSFTADYADYTYVLNCNQSDVIMFVGGYYYIDIQSIKIYAGELTSAQLKAIAEEGDADYRLVTGITAKNYTVKDLTAAGTYYYRARATYVNGDQGLWSDYQVVTLYENGTPSHGYDLGDVNHDEVVDVSDVTAVISYILGNATESVCTICADMDGNSTIDVSDVTALISMILGNS